MRTINFNDEDIKECKLALANQHITPLQSAFLLQYINNIEANLDKLEQENKLLKAGIISKDRYSYGIRMGSDKE